jgi:hypothetical protein
MSGAFIALGTKAALNRGAPKGMDFSSNQWQHGTASENADQ